LVEKNHCILFIFRGLLETISIISLFNSFIQFISGCVVLPNEEILVAGFPSAHNSAVIYNHLENKWSQVEDAMYDKYFGAGLVVLGSRIFSTGGAYDRVVEEFDYSSRSWKSVETPLLQPRCKHSATPIPAEVFAHLPGGCQGVA
jgi:hypothetical protein